MTRNLWLPAVILTAAASGCVVRARPAPVVVTAQPEYGTVYVQQPPPAPIAEVRYAPPAPDHVWVDGYWDWTGADWTWTAGYYAPPRYGYAYVRPAYVYEGGQYVYRRGYWDGGGHR